MGAGKDKQAVQATKVTKVKGKAQKPATKTAKKAAKRVLVTEAPAQVKKPATKKPATKKAAGRK